MFARALIISMIVIPAGCASFKTTVMQRATDSRFYPNLPEEKTRGVPVKLKVPTHVEVKILESYFMHNAAGINAQAKDLKAKADLEKAQKAATDAGTPAAAQTALEAAMGAEAVPRAALKDHDSNVNREKVRSAARQVEVAQDRKNNAECADKDLETAKTAAAKAAADLKGVVPQYNEAHVTRRSDRHRVRNLSVDTKLCYTDKVFTVDFRRPAGGILNLSRVAMDSQQYFAAVQADYEEQTLQQINTAIGTVKSAIGGTPSTGATATAGTVEMQDTKSDNTTPLLAADTRIVAMARFDISEPDWEDQLHGFIDRHVTGCYPNCQIENCPPTSP